MSFTEILILAVIGLVVLGPEELPAMARKLARFLNELRKVKDEILGPMTDFHETTNKLLGDSHNALNKDLSDLLNLRGKLDQQIADIQKPSPSAVVHGVPTPNVPADQIAHVHASTPAAPVTPTPAPLGPEHTSTAPGFNPDEPSIDLSAPFVKASEKKPDGHS